MQPFYQQNARFLASQAMERLRNEDRSPGAGAHRVYCIDGMGYLVQRGEMTLGINFDSGEQRVRRSFHPRTIHLRTPENDGGLGHGTEI